MAKSQYKRDQEVESITAQFLDEYFYSKAKSKSIVQRYHDEEHQFSGIDISINETNFDEKVKYYGCLNQIQQFVGFECSLKNRGGYIQDGWYLNDDLKTDYYAIIGLYTTVEDSNLLSSESQISSVDVLWVKKTDIDNLLIKNGKSKLEIKSDIEKFRVEYTPSFYQGKQRKKYESISDFWLTFSKHLREEPINLVIPRQILEALPFSKHFVVTRGKVSIIKNSTKFTK